MIWDQNINNVQNSFISQPQQHYCRELFSKLFTEEERKSLANKKYLSREELINDSKTELQMLVDDITFEQARPFISKIDKEYRQKFSIVFSELLDSLPRDKLNKFQYLSPGNKEKVLSVVQVLLTNKVLKREYDDFLNYHYRIAKDYSPSKKEIKVAVLKAKEDIEKRLCNLVLREIRDMGSITQEESREAKGTSPVEPQEPEGTSSVEPQEPEGTSPVEPQEPEGTSPVEPQEPGYHAKQEESYHMYRLVNTFLDALLYANNTRTPSSVYSSGKDKGNVKALREWKREQGFSMENSNY